MFRIDSEDWDPECGMRADESGVCVFRELLLDSSSVVACRMEADSGSTTPTCGKLMCTGLTGVFCSRTSVVDCAERDGMAFRLTEEVDLGCAAVRGEEESRRAQGGIGHERIRVALGRIGPAYGEKRLVNRGVESVVIDRHGGRALLQRARRAALVRPRPVHPGQLDRSVRPGGYVLGSGPQRAGRLPGHPGRHGARHADGLRSGAAPLPRAGRRPPRHTSAGRTPYDQSLGITKQELEAQVVTSMAAFTASPSLRRLGVSLSHQYITPHICSASHALRI